MFGSIVLPRGPCVVWWAGLEAGIEPIWNHSARALPLLAEKGEKKAEPDRATFVALGTELPSSFNLTPCLHPGRATGSLGSGTNSRQWGCCKRSAIFCPVLFPVIWRQTWLRHLYSEKPWLRHLHLWKATHKHGKPNSVSSLIAWTSTSVVLVFLEDKAREHTEARGWEEDGISSPSHTQVGKSTGIWGCVTVRANG